MPFWLSHHPPDEASRTVRLFGVAVCARCLGTYPVLFAALAVQWRVNAPRIWEWDGPWCVGLLVPALADWAYGRFRPGAFNNAWRWVTGAALGLALGRSLYVHIQRPFPLWLVVQAAGVTAVALPVILISYLRAKRI